MDTCCASVLSCRAWAGLGAWLQAHEVGTTSRRATGLERPWSSSPPQHFHLFVCPALPAFVLVGHSGLGHKGEVACPRTLDVAGEQPCGSPLLRASAEAKEGPDYKVYPAGDVEGPEHGDLVFPRSRGRDPSFATRSREGPDETVDR